jgi:hypothetical protein
MQKIIAEEGRLTDLKVREAVERDEDREMEECLAKLRVWQTENLMAPHGMDRFVEKKSMAPKMSPVNISRIIMGTVILSGLLFFKPAAYVAASMMIIAGLTRL